MEFNEAPEPINTPPTETVQIGETFKLFVPNRTRTETSSGDYGYKGFPIFDSRVSLGTKGFLPKLPVLAHAFPAYKNRAQAFAPFFPEDGYQVTSQDLDKNTRLNKKADLIRFNSEDILSSPLLLGVYLERDEPDRANKLTEEELRFLQQLRLQVFFPNGLRFEARSKDIRENGDASFHDGYYPIDSGPLAPVPHLYTEGLQIAVPGDLEKLQQIEAMFLLSPPNLNQDPTKEN